MARKNAERKEESLVVAIDKDKGSQSALRWAVDHLLTRGQSLTLLHVKTKPSSIPSPQGTNVAIADVNEDVAKTYNRQLENQARELFLPFRCFCTRKDIKSNEVLLEDSDIPKAIIEYVASNAIEILILGTPSRSGLVRKFKATDVPSIVSRLAPDFCTVYVISKGKISSVRSATSPAPPKPSPQIQLQQNTSNVSSPRGSERSLFSPNYNHPEEMEIKSPFTRGKGPLSKTSESSLTESDISFVSIGRPSTDHMFPSYYDSSEGTPRISTSSESDRRSFVSSYSGNRSLDMSLHNDFSSSFNDSGRSTWSPNHLGEIEAEMRRLRLELKQIMEMYSLACKEALTAKQKARELHQWKMEEQQRLEQARLSEQAALALVEKEKVKCKAAIEAAEAAKKLAELEAQKRMHAELKALRESEEKRTALDTLGHYSDVRYRKYTIEEIEEATEDFAENLKIGEGGYGPVYKGYLDHTPVAIKVLRPDASQGQSQFQQEVEVLSCIRHPNMVLLLGACPEYGCLVYEYMANGSLDDRLFRRGNTPPLSWQVRFQIAAEIGTALLFLHQTKPEPLVHRDLKPGNILLDHNFVSKISDVGLARLVPPSVANSVTQYRMTSAAGTFCYIDPEYQQTGMLGIKSDIYSLGVIFLQLITAKPPMGLTHHVETAIEQGTFAEILDPSVIDWPVDEALKFAKLALQCTELKRKDRPDLGKVLLPELNKFRALAEESTQNLIFTGSSPCESQVSTQEELSDAHSGYASSMSRSSS